MDKANIIITSMGGPTKVARLLGFGQTPGAVQRVSNWKKRGIPSRVLLEHAALFRPYLSLLGYLAQDPDNTPGTDDSHSSSRRVETGSVP
ncbi:MAG TPA: hypothetical protein PLP85_13665 [Alcaligenes sp.]|nr:hypothetical protein [Alcaligenes sp.]